LILTGFNILCWCIPLRYKNFTQNNDILSLANSFSGGIFLMLCYGHLLPESISLLLSASDSSSDSSSSSINNKVITKALLYCLFGYMLMLFIEKVAFNTSHHNHDNNNDCEISYNNNSINRSSSITSTSDSRNKNVNHNSTSGSVKSAIALCSALSIHSFFEAMALGISTDITSATMMTTCISLHQPAESIALLVAFLKSGINHKKIYIYLTLYSLVALVGVITGVLVNKMASSSIEGIIMAITAGTFIYVGATEVRMRLMMMIIMIMIMMNNYVIR
jgi:zinc transporter ZupT